MFITPPPPLNNSVVLSKKEKTGGTGNRMLLSLLLVPLFLVFSCNPGDGGPPPPVSYTLAVAQGITNGTVTLSTSSATAGTKITVTIETAPDYTLKPDSLQYSNGTTDTSIDEDVLPYSFFMPAASITVSAEFVPADSSAPEYEVTIAPLGGHATITANPTKTISGKPVTLTVSPEAKWRLKENTLKYRVLNASDVPQGAEVPIDENTRQFTMPGAPPLGVDYKIRISAEFEELFTVTPAILAGGTLQVSPSPAAAGETVTVTVYPKLGYIYTDNSITVNEDSIGTGTTFTMPAENVTVSATFTAIAPELNQYAVSVAPVTPGTGTVTVSPAGPYDESDPVTVTAAPAPGYQLASLKANGGALENDDITSGTPFNMPAAHVTVTATFTKISYDINTNTTVTATFPTGATLTVNSTTATIGDSVTVTASPAPGYQLTRVYYTDKDALTGEVSLATLATQQFNAPAKAITVRAVFTKITYTISKPASITGGAITIKKGETEVTTAQVGDTIKVTLTPAETWYRYKDNSLHYEWTGEPFSIDDDPATITFEMPAANILVKAEFELIPFAITLATSLTGAADPTSLTASAAVAVKGVQITITPHPLAGWKTTKVTWNDGTDHDLTEAPYVFTMPGRAVGVTAVFEKIPYTVTLTQATVANGSISVAPSPAVVGDTITVTVTPGTADYRLKADSLKYSGGGISNAVISGPPYTFSMPPGNVTIPAPVFELIPVLNIGFTSFDNEKAVLTGNKSNDLSKSAKDVIRITVGSGLSVQAWYQDGSLIDEATPSYRDFKAVDLSAGIHHVAVQVLASGVPYSKEVQFKVVDVVYYNVQSGETTNGTLSFDPVSAIQETPITVTPNPAAGYRLKANTLKFSGGTQNNVAISGPPISSLCLPGIPR
jgi:hypothetical protein